MKQKKEQTITKILLIIYLIVLTWLILFKMETHLPILFRMQYRNINLIPFYGSLITNGTIDISEILLNILVFVPFGVYISMLKTEWRFFQKVLPVFCVSLAYEVLQFIFGIGASDITDLLGNTLGGIIGILLFGLLSKVWKDTTIKIINRLASIGTFVVILLMGILIAANR